MTTITNVRTGILTTENHGSLNSRIALHLSYTMYNVICSFVINGDRVLAYNFLISLISIFVVWLLLYCLFHIFFF